MCLKLLGMLRLIGGFLVRTLRFRERVSSDFTGLGEGMWDFLRGDDGVVGRGSGCDVGM